MKCMVRCCVVLLMLPGLACTASPPTPTEIITTSESTSEPTPVPSAEPTQPPSPTPLSPPEPTPTQQDTLSEAGPWLAFATENQDDSGLYTLWAANTDGSGLTQIVSPLSRHGISAAPDASKLAVVTATTFNHGYTLNILTLPDGRLTPVTPLTSSETEPPPDIYHDDPRIDLAWRMISHTPDWSPDGQSLAFTSTHDGATVDPYIYHLNSGEIVHVAETPYHTYETIWSPDGRYLLYIDAAVWAGARNIPDDVDPGIWIVAVDDGTPRRLAPASTTDTLRFSGWLTPDMVIVFSTGFNSAPNTIQVIDITTGEVTLVWEKFISNMWGIALDEGSGTLAFTASEDWIDILGDGTVFEKGVYLFRAGDSEAQRVSDLAGLTVGWSHVTGRFYVQVGREGTLAVTPDGTVEPVDAPRWWVEFSHQPGSDDIMWRVMYSKFWGGVGEGRWEGIWISAPGNGQEQLYTESSPWAEWSPDGSHLWFINEDRKLRVVTLADTDVVHGIHPTDMQIASWIRPVWVQGP